MSANDSREHESVIKTPQQLIMVVVMPFVVPVIGILLLVELVIGGIKTDPDGKTTEAVAGRIKPVAQLTVSAGEAAGGAPKVGDAAAWGKLVVEGQQKLVADAMKGVRGMPHRGGNPDLSDYEFERAVVYMANKSGGNFKEPAAPKPAAAK